MLLLKYLKGLTSDQMTFEDWAVLVFLNDFLKTEIKHKNKKTKELIERIDHLTSSFSLSD